VRAANGAVRAVELPARVRPEVAYGIGVLSRAPNRALAERFVRGLEDGGPGTRYLAEAGFLPPP
jgi:ABC-type molybdate transport system substrate-binding protein